MPDRLVHVRTEDNVTILTLDDGKVNVFSPAMAEELHERFHGIDRNTGAVVVTGRPGVFSAGFDLKTIASGDVALATAMVTKTVRMAMDVLAFPRPVIGAATGHVVAMGALFLMTMDYRLGARGNFKIGLNEVKDGLILPIFAVELPRFRLPTAGLISSTLHSTLYDADGAVAAGFLEEAVNAEQLLDTAVARAKKLAALPNPAYHVSKMNLVRGVRDHILQTLDADLASLYQQ